MSIFSSLIPLFFNWPVGITVALIALAALAIFYFEGLPALISDALNPRYWLICGGIIALVAFINAGQTIQQQKQDAVVAQGTITAQHDSGAVVTDVNKKKQDNAVVSHTIQHAIATAPVGNQEDAVWDTIIEQSQPDAGSDTTPK